MTERNDILMNQRTLDRILEQGENNGHSIQEIAKDILAEMVNINETHARELSATRIAISRLEQTVSGMGDVPRITTVLDMRLTALEEWIKSRSKREWAVIIGALIALIASGATLVRAYILIKVAGVG